LTISIATALVKVPPTSMPTLILLLICKNYLGMPNFEFIK
jgi:hypothetical protein